MTALPLVTVLVPAFNEANDIVGCLEAIAAQDYPINRLEVIVADGCSADGTADAAGRSLARLGFGSTAVLSNEGRTASSNLNAGLTKATGDIVCRVDARTRIQPHHVRTCVDVLAARPDVAVVGGAQIAIARDRRVTALGIARALNNRWSMGGSPYRRARASGESDTVYLGSFRRLELVDEGGWDEALVSNQDFDLNRRMARHGIVWFEASLRSGYLPRTTYGDLWRQYTRFGRAKVRYWHYAGARPQRRQWLLLVAPPAVAVTAVASAAASQHRGAQVLRLAIGGLGAAAVIEAKGATEPRGGPASRVAAVAAMATVAGGWWFGAAAEALSGRSER